VDAFEKYGPKIYQAWHQFVSQEQLTVAQAQAFEQYTLLLLAWNDIMNITTITDIPILLKDHFQDSLRLAQFLPLTDRDWFCDVGSGGGFPGIPLKIMYPDVPMVLLEVNNKKARFLNTVIETLGLKGIEVCTLDWRTFIRKAPYPITVFVARASLRPDELIRIFKPGCAYKHAQLVYWASKNWELGTKEVPFLEKEERYDIGNKHRRLLFFKQQEIAV
jgi:16S rRNA (guanine(527)-N(7))-methyltransferase RsmG